MCAKCQEKIFKKMKMDSKKLRMVLVIFHIFPSLKTKPLQAFTCFLCFATAKQSPLNFVNYSFAKLNPPEKLYGSGKGVLKCM